MEVGRSEWLDGVGGGSVGMGLVWVDWGPVAEVRKGGRESTVDVKPGTRRTTIFCMHCVFRRPMSSNGMTPARWREI